MDKTKVEKTVREIPAEFRPVVAMLIILFTSGVVLVVVGLWTR